MDAVIQWVENAKHLKYLHISGTCVGGTCINGGRDTGARLAKVLAGKDTMEILKLFRTDLIGSRNVNEWTKALGEMASLKEFKCWGMKDYVNSVDESTLDHNSTVNYPAGDTRQRIYWKGGTFPDASFLSVKDAQKLSEAVPETGKTFIRRI